MGSLFDVPAQLALLLSLATSAPHDAAPALSAAGQPQAVEVAVEPAAGPMRFGERAWLRALHDDPKAGGDLSRVFVTSSGRFYVPSAAERQRVLEARNDPELSARVARAAAERNAGRLQRALRRAPTPAELYMAHVLGPEAAVAVIAAARTTPNTIAAKRFPGLLNLPEGRETLGSLYARFNAAVRPAPRPLAIELKPALADPPPPADAVAPKPRASLAGAASAWQARVDIAEPFVSAQ